MTKHRAPNRVLDLDELALPEFSKTLAALEGLTEQEDLSYLHPSKRWEYPWALSRAQLRSDSHILDAGCGASIFPVYLATLGHRVTALDLKVPDSLGEAHGVSVNYCRGELTDMPFDDESFDHIFCISVIEHLGHQGAPAALAEMRRTLKPGGRLLLTTDFYEDANAAVFYQREGERFPVDWGFYDEQCLQRYLLNAPGWRLEGELDLSVDWEETKSRMQRFHGYPYTSVGLTLVRDD